MRRSYARRRTSTTTLLLLLLASRTSAFCTSSGTGTFTLSRLDGRAFLRMDDERARQGIKVELTTRDDWLEQRFTRLSESGHDLTPLTKNELEATQELKPSHTLAESIGVKGLYVCAQGGLPIFSSGDRINEECDSKQLVFLSPCDAEHVRIDVDADVDADSSRVLCTRSGKCVASYVVDSNRIHGGKYVVLLPSSNLAFFDLSRPFPIASQPESLWGTEDQYSYRKQTQG